MDVFEIGDGSHSRYDSCNLCLDKYFLAWAGVVAVKKHMDNVAQIDSTVPLAKPREVANVDFVSDADVGIGAGPALVLVLVLSCVGCRRWAVALVCVDCRWWAAVWLLEWLLV